jgi:iron(III) transport system substrate-binding protein
MGFSRKNYLRTLQAFLLAGTVGATSIATGANAADQATIDAAIKEGKLVYASNSFAPTTQDELQAEFRKYYGLPDSFEIEGNIGNSSNVISRVNQEIEADAVTVDWVSVNAASFWSTLKKQDGLLEYCSDEYSKLVFTKQVQIMDGGCLFQSINVVVFGLIWNPQYVDGRLTSWSQLADPKYKDAVIFGDVRKSASYLDAYVGLRENNVWTLDWLNRIKEQNPFFLLRSTDIRDRVMAGEFPIAILGFPPRAYQVRDEIKLDASFPTDGVVVAGSYAGILKKAPNPNAAKLWTDFIFSQKGQEILVRLEAIASLRDDVVVPPDVRPFVPVIAEINAVPVDWANLSDDKLTKYREEFRNIFGQ